MMSHCQPSMSIRLEAEQLPHATAAAVTMWQSPKCHALSHPCPSDWQVQCSFHNVLLSPSVPQKGHWTQNVSWHVDESRA